MRLKCTLCDEPCTYDDTLRFTSEDGEPILEKDGTPVQIPCCGRACADVALQALKDWAAGEGLKWIDLPKGETVDSLMDELRTERDREFSFEDGEPKVADDWGYESDDVSTEPRPLFHYDELVAPGGEVLGRVWMESASHDDKVRAVVVFKSGDFVSSCDGTGSDYQDAYSALLEDAWVSLVAWGFDDAQQTKGRIIVAALAKYISDKGYCV